jgi:hypothetical protein
MSRTDIHQDAMLRHLGAAYYESLHGRALPTDVTPAHPTVRLAQDIDGMVDVVNQTSPASQPT